MHNKQTNRSNNNINEKRVNSIHGPRLVIASKLDATNNRKNKDIFDDDKFSADVLVYFNSYFFLYLHYNYYESLRHVLVAAHMYSSFKASLCLLKAVNCWL